MSPDYLVIFPELFHTPIFTLHSLLFALFFTSLLAFCLTPGGPAWALCKTRNRTRSLIPGPPGLPVTGSLHIFTGSKPHRALASLARTLNAKPLMSLSVGLTRFVVSSDPGTAKEILSSSAFADRPVKESAYELLFHRAMGFAPYGEYWRNLRRISATHLFSPCGLSASEASRREVGVRMVKMVEERSGEVELRKVLRYGALNNVMVSVFGKWCEEVGEVEVEELVREGYEVLGIFNWSDHFPIVGWLDLQGVRRRSRCLVSKVNGFVGRIIEEHRSSKRRVLGGEDGGGGCAGDFLNVLLGLEKEHKLKDSDIIAVLWELIFRGTDTVAILLEWILARMVLHPEIQSKAQSEIDTVVKTSNAVSDSDIPNLRYLQSIVKEALRLHPPGPLLSWARLAAHDVHIADKHIPGGTTAVVNMWAIAHDETVWAEPERFEPERFMREEVNVMGCDLRLAPFGSGRRVCPGKAMGLATVHLWLAMLLQRFKWVRCGSVDLDECLKLSMEMKKPLVCRAVPRVASP